MGRTLGGLRAAGTAARSQTFGVIVGFAAGLLIAALVVPGHQSVKVVGAAGGTSTDVAAGAAPGATPTTTATGGPDTGGATAAGTPTAGGGAAPSSGTVTQAQSAAGGDQQAAATGNGGATAQGVTATSIKVGISIFDVSAYKYLGDVANVGDIKQQWDAVFDQWHHDGTLPINGRDIQPIYRTHSVGTTGGDPASERATCTGFANDDKVFMVVGTASYTTGADCVSAEFHLPILVDTGISDDKLARDKPYLFSIGTSMSRLLRNFVHWADANHFLAGHKVGIYTLNDADTQDMFNKNVISEMGKMGYKPAATASTDNNLGGPNDAITVQQFRAAGVDVVMLFAAPGGFSQQAESQGYHPKYITTDFNYETADSSAGLMPADQYEGSAALTGRRDGEGAAGAKEDDKQEACLKNYERFSGRTIQRHTANKSDPVEYRQILLTCDEAEILQQALKAAGPTLTKASLIGAMETNFKDWNSRDYPHVTWTAAQHDGVQQQRTLIAHTSCNCWQAYGDLGPWWVP